MALELPQGGTKNLALNILKLAILLFLLLFVVTYTGLIRCSTVPFWCTPYHQITSLWQGQTKILIVHGGETAEGLGDPQKLRQLLANPNYGGVMPELLHIDQVSTGTLTKYSIVIVEKAKTIPTNKIISFIEYVNLGGRLVWIGDSGTQLAEGDLIPDENTLYGVDKYKKPNPWIRIKDDMLYSFDNVLNVEYMGNYCDYFICVDKPVRLGLLEPEPTGDHPLIKGMSVSMNFYLATDKDFSLVKTYPGKFTNEVLSVDFGSSLTSSKGIQIQRITPLAVYSGIGERVLYLAIPPEYLVDESLSSNNLPTYPTPLENLISSLLN